VNSTCPKVNLAEEWVEMSVEVAWAAGVGMRCGSGVLD
jgi:hypothetical protein